MTSTPVTQRFCPLCNRPFAEGEAVLRCEGCRVMHHPGCWVTNGGCATEAAHKVQPVAMAFESAAPPVAKPTAHPGEGTRVTAPPETEEPNRPLRFTARQRPKAGAEPPVPEPVAVDATATDAGQQPSTPVVGGNEPMIGAVPRGPKRYLPSTADPASSRTKPMPSIYGRHRILAYWYVPAAMVLVIVVALGVIWLGDQFRGNGSSNASVSASTPLPGAALTPAPTTAAGGATDVAPGTAGATAKFKVGDTATVVGTGDCLNVRAGPARANAAITCLSDGTTVSITDGPQNADQLTWWKVHTASGDGWAAQDFLQKK